MSDQIFQSSDLATKRTEVLEAARNGRARVRDKDGTSLVMLPESRLRVLETLMKWWQASSKLDVLLHKSSELPRTGELGELAWLRPFDREDFEEFARELQEVLVAASADEDTRVLDECIRAWRITARELEDPLRESVLRAPFVPEHYVEASRPDASE